MVNNKLKQDKIILKASWDSKAVSSSGSWFHSLMVDGLEVVFVCVGPAVWYPVFVLMASCGPGTWLSLSVGCSGFGTLH